MIDPAEHLGLVYLTARRLGARHPVEDSDQFADGCLGLIRAAQRFRPERGRWYAYACWGIRSAILDGLRRRSRQNQDTLLDELPEIAVTNTAFNEVDHQDQLAYWSRRILETCGHREHELFRHLTNGDSVPQAARRLGKSTSTGYACRNTIRTVLSRSQT